MSNYNKYGKLTYIYDLEKHILIKNIEKHEEEEFLKNPKYVFCFEIKNKKSFIYNDKHITFDKFPWKTYYKINSELISKETRNNNKQNAWYHWITYGKNEERAFSYINNTNDHRARFGNLFFLNMCLHLFSLKFNLKSSYKYVNEFHQFGIDFFKGKNLYKKNLLLTDFNFENLLKSDTSPNNVIINNDMWCHTNNFCKIINKYFTENNLFEKVKNKNVYKTRYNNNNDLFIHLRLGDVSEKTIKSKDYYIKLLEEIQFDEGYISSDNINDPFCKYLIKEYDLIVINKSEIKTIMFGNTCKNIILSGGTFSWLIGFFAEKESCIFYPEIQDTWYGDIFSFTNWNKV